MRDRDARGGAGAARGARARRPAARAGPRLPRDGPRALAPATAACVVTDFRGLDHDARRQPLPDLHALPDRQRRGPPAGGPGREKVAVSAGRSIFNRTSRANLGVLLSVHGGGGHPGAAACAAAGRRGRRHGSPRSSPRSSAMAEFVVGANLPWIEYGQDFGASAWQPRGRRRPPGPARADAPRPRAPRRTRAPRSCGGGCSATGAPACARTSDGRVLGVDDRLFDDVDAALDGAPRGRPPRASSWSPTSSGSTSPAAVTGARLVGRRHLVRDPARRERLLERVFAPIAERYGRDADDRRLGPDERARVGDPGVSARSIPAARSRGARCATFLREAAAVFRARATQPVTVGLASPRWLSLLDGVDLDFHQVHWYESLDSATALARPVEALDPGRPLLLGEFPTRGASLGPGASSRSRERPATRAPSPGPPSPPIRRPTPSPATRRSAAGPSRGATRREGLRPCRSTASTSGSSSPRRIGGRGGDRSRWAETCGPSGCSSRTRWASSRGRATRSTGTRPDPRMVLLADELRVPRSLRRAIRRRPFRLTFDTRLRATS